MFLGGVGGGRGWGVGRLEEEATNVSSAGGQTQRWQNTKTRGMLKEPPTLPTPKGEGAGWGVTSFPFYSSFAHVLDVLPGCYICDTSLRHEMERI